MDNPEGRLLTSSAMRRPGYLPALAHHNRCTLRFYLCLFSILACTDISVKCKKPLRRQLLSEIRRQQIRACISIVFMLFCFYFSGILLPENIILGGGRSVRISPPKDQFSALRSELFQPVLLFCILLCRFKKGMMPLTTR